MISDNIIYFRGRKFNLDDTGKYSENDGWVYLMLNRNGFHWGDAYYIMINEYLHLAAVYYIRENRIIEKAYDTLSFHLRYIGIENTIVTREYANNYVKKMNGKKQNK